MLLNDNRGFTFIEFGVVALALIAAGYVIYVIGLKFTTNQKYATIRQNATELATYVQQWAEMSIQAQDESTSTSTVYDYYLTLAVQGDSPTDIGNGRWIADQSETSNWHLKDSDMTPNFQLVAGRRQIGATGDSDVAPETCVEQIIPKEKAFTNPFNGVNIFRAPNDPMTEDSAVSGALALGGQHIGDNKSPVYFAFCFQSIQNTKYNLESEQGTVSSGDDEDKVFFPGSNLVELAGLKNGIYLGTVR